MEEQIRTWKSACDWLTPHNYYKNDPEIRQRSSRFRSTSPAHWVSQAVRVAFPRFLFCFRGDLSPGHDPGRCAERCQNLTVRRTRTITTRHNLTIYHNHPMCLPFCLKWKGKPRPSEASGAADHSKVEEAVQLRPKEPISPKHTIRAAPSDSPPQVQQQLQIPAVPESLPSQVDETLAECPR